MKHIATQNVLSIFARVNFLSFTDQTFLDIRQRDTIGIFSIDTEYFANDL